MTAAVPEVNLLGALRPALRFPTSAWFKVAIITGMPGPIADNTT